MVRCLLATSCVPKAIVLASVGARQHIYRRVKVLFFDFEILKIFECVPNTKVLLVGMYTLAHNMCRMSPRGGVANV